ncbi:MAG: L-lactate dehydrogenase [Candidatus Omnitrophica bacterium]|nr:L-lactate dehydrogenase [Candidatus Omnitrophota bacterium]
MTEANCPELSPKVAVVGCGNVGVRFAYALIISGAARQLVMIDTDRRRAEGEVMDLCHGAPFIAPVDIRAGDYADSAGAELVVVTAGKKQKPNQSRLDLAKDNVDLFREIIPQIVQYSPQAKLLIATNPVDVLAYAAYRFSGKPAHEVIGSGTVLDSARFRFLLSRHCQVDARNVHAYILGEHGDTEFAVWSTAMIGGVRFADYCRQCRFYPCCFQNPGLQSRSISRDKAGVERKSAGFRSETPGLSPRELHDEAGRQDQLEAIFSEVRDSAYQIIERKGETSYGIGLAMVRIAQAMFNDENAILPVSSLIDGYLGVRNVYLSLPAIVNRRGVRDVMRLDLNAAEQAAFIRSAEKMRQIIADTGIETERR